MLNSDIFIINTSSTKNYAVLDIELYPHVQLLDD